ncbi:MAG: ATP-binding protein [Pseudomonadota bacterium]
MSLRLKTILGVAAIEAVLLVILVTTVLGYLRSTNEDGLMQRAQTTATLFATTTKDAVLSFDLASLETFANEILRNPGVVYARVLGSDNTVFAEAGDRRHLGKTFSKDTSLKSVDDAVFDVSASIEEGGHQYGQVQIGISTSALDAAIAKAQKLSAIIAIVEMLLVALFSYCLGAYLTAKLKTLRAAAKQISSGDLDVQIREKGGDEIADVARAFNRMIENLKATQRRRDEYEQKLVDVNQTLEDRVKRRTGALEEKNKELSSAYDELQTAQAQVVQSEKLASVGQLAAGVAHEINNPVGFVNSNLQSLKDYLDDYQNLLEVYDRYLQAGDESRPAIAQEIARVSDEIDIEFVKDDVKQLLIDSIEGTTRVRDIVQGLKDFSRVDSTDRQMFDVNKCIESTLKVANNELKYHCSVETDLLALPPTLCNPGQLNQLFLNLIVNAGHAVEEKGKVTVTSHVEDEFIYITIGDNGCGIAEENLEKLFDPFFTTKPVGQGTGLGLSISYGIVQEHNGCIDVTSEVGVGTTFTIVLPVTTNESDQAA